MELIIISIAYILGIIWGIYFNISISFFLPCLLLACALLKGKYRKYLIIFSIAMLISYAHINILENKFQTKYQNIDGNVNIIGTIESEPKATNYSTQYILKVENIDKKNLYKNTKLLLNIKSSYCSIKYGDKIKISGELEDASSARNEGGFNYKEYLKIKGIYKIISVKKDSIEVLAENNTNIIDRFVHFVRNKIKEVSIRILPDEEANFLVGILIGDKTNLDEEIKDDFRNSNLSHILAVSGMHVSYIILGVSFIISKLKIGKKSMKIFIIIFLAFFILLTGATPSVQRACVMSIYVLVGSMLHKRTNVLNSIAFSMIVILLINPYNLLDIGLQLSFGGTLGIVLIYPVLSRWFKKKIKLKNKIINKILDISIVTISANIILIPIILYHYNTISTTFLISNLLVSPFIAIIIILGFINIIIFYIFYPITKIISVPLKLSIDFIIQIAKLIGNIPFSQIYFITPKIYMIVLYYLIIGLLLNSKKIQNKELIKKIVTILLIFIILFNFIFIKIIPRDLRIYFIDVGQRRLYFDYNSTK